MAFTFTQGLAPQGAGQQQGVAGTADMILRAGTLMQQKRTQAYARYSQARNIMRDDLKAFANFDNTVGGMGQFSDALNTLAEDARVAIREANDTIEAQEIIANFREQYNMVKAREESIAEKKELYEKTSTASGSQIDNLNQSLDVDSQYVIPEVSGVANAQNAWDNPYVEDIQVIDGRLMAVDPADNILKEIGDIEATLNSSMFDLQTEQITAGSVSDWATTSAIKTKIGLKDGSWSPDRAGQLYDDAIDDIGRTKNREDSGEWHRRQVLNTLESRDLIEAFTADERRAFINGGFDFFNTNSSKETLDEVIKKGKEIFIEESKFGLKSPTEIVAAQTKAMEGYSKRGLTAVSQRPAANTAEGFVSEDYDLYSIPATIEVTGSEHVEGGEYDIFGFGVDPVTGNPVARIKQTEKVIMYEYIDNGVEHWARTLEEAWELGEPTGDTEEFTKGGTPETIEISADGTGMSREAFNKLFAEDPAAYNLLLQEIETINLSKLNEALSNAAKMEEGSSAAEEAPAAEEVYNASGLISTQQLMNDLPSNIKEAINAFGFTKKDVEEMIREENITSARQFADLMESALQGRI